MRNWQSLIFAAMAAALNMPLGAAVISLGEQVSPGLVGVANGGLLGKFEDRYTFSIAPGISFDFFGFLSTGFSNRFGILDFEGDLFAGDTLLASGDSLTRRTPEGFVAYDVFFLPVGLAAGDYSIVLTGNAVGAFEGITASYAGDLSFAPAISAVPEPETLLLFMTGLIFTGFRMMAPITRLLPPPES